ncbi:SH3 domain-containing protein [Ancylothrix sp. C2]|uniref:SH3 domain-containing protein n=1 Tax=Ancylothrix sp. D3o TaxID=2953691 RepID=UPI0021BB08CE|nr:SH3 domain-containing protein [Ancylothrix sp. D3o]MCT7950066.1 SH3 domain-containing protein [Ancylothrix sp. D3o]
MFSSIFPVSVAFLISSTPVPFENTQLPIPDQRGDYQSIQKITHDGKPVQGARGEHRYWRVMTVGLNCRNAPGTNNKIIRQFAKNDVLQAGSFGRGGSDEVIVIQKDKAGKPWLRVVIKGGQCFVRANSKFINPAVPPPY